MSLKSLHFSLLYGNCEAVGGNRLGFFFLVCITQYRGPTKAHFETNLRLGRGPWKNSR